MPETTESTATQVNTEEAGTETAAEETASAEAEAGGKEESASKEQEASEKKDEAASCEGDEKTEDSVPDRYDLKAPDYTKLRTADIERIEAEARAAGMTNEEAQVYLETHHNAVMAYHDALMKDFESEREGWVKAAQDDKEIGGDDFAENVEIAKRLVKSVATEKFYKEVLAPKSEGGQGYGDHPEILRMFVRLAKRGFAEDKLEHGGSTQRGDKPLEKRLYPNLT